jgi:hypothetical protein
MHSFHVLWMSYVQPKWPEQSDELLGLIVNSLRILEEVVPQGVPEPRCRPKSVQKISLVLDKVPKHSQPDLNVHSCQSLLTF